MRFSFLLDTVITSTSARVTIIVCGARCERKASAHLRLHPAAASAKRSHTVFVDSKVELKKFNAADFFDTMPELVGRTFNRHVLPRLNPLRYSRSPDIVNGLRACVPRAKSSLP